MTLNKQVNMPEFDNDIQSILMRQDASDVFFNNAGIVAAYSRLVESKIEINLDSFSDSIKDHESQHGLIITDDEIRIIAADFLSRV